MYVVKRLTKCRNKDIAMIKTRLDLYNDSWRTAQPEPFVSVEKTSDRNASNENGVKGKMSKNLGGKRMRKTGNTTGPKDGTKVRRRKTKEEKIKDPNAPKRPANPFFQFCQEQRSVIMDEMNSELSPGEPEPSKQELTRQLAHRWRMMDNNDKQVILNSSLFHFFFSHTNKNFINRYTSVCMKALK